MRQVAGSTAAAIALAITINATPAVALGVDGELNNREADTYGEFGKGTMKQYGSADKSTDPRLKENFDLSFEIGVAEMERLDGLEAGKALAFGSAGQPLDPTMAA